MTLGSRLSRYKNFWQTARAILRDEKDSSPDLESTLATLSKQIPTPTLWLFGRTQSGKTSIIRHLTAAEDAEIGSGFRPCTKMSRIYPFPTADSPVLRFLDTRGVDEPTYDPTEDIAAFRELADLVLVTCRFTDFTHGALRTSLAEIRKSSPNRPIVLALTCLHEAYPQQQHPESYPFDPLGGPRGSAPKIVRAIPEDAERLVREQSSQFEGLVDRIVPIDLTKPDEGYVQPDFGGEGLRTVLLDLLPETYRAAFARSSEACAAFKEFRDRKAWPVIIRHSSVAAAAGAIPVPFVDLLLLPTIQTRMVHELALLHGEPATASTFLESAASLGIGLAARQAIRELVKAIPFLGSATSAALAGASTYALGRAYLKYQQAVHSGHTPSPGMLRKIYEEQFKAAEKSWKVA